MDFIWRRWLPTQRGGPRASAWHGMGDRQYCRMKKYSHTAEVHNENEDGAVDDARLSALTASSS